jgi:hypothetical protein
MKIGRCSPFAASLLSLAAAAAAAAAAACSGTPERTTASSSAALTAGDSTTVLAGTWAFVLDASDVAAKVRADCETRFGGDTGRKDTCYDEVRTEGATEKIRFSKDPAGHTLWTSFGEKGDKTELFLEVPMDLSSESPTSVLGKVAGEARGIQAKEPHTPVGTVIRFELVDSQTLAMIDPKKGKLVFHKE